MKYKINKNNDKETINYMKKVIDYLSVDSEINDEWIGSLQLLEDSFNTFILCSKKLENEGLFINDRFGSLISHPAIKVKNDANIQVQKLMIEFGLTKKSQLKLSENQTDNSKESPSPLSIFEKKYNK